MKIVVCMKQIEQVYAQSGMDPQRNYLEPLDHIVRLNPHDEAALEAALRLKERTPGTVISLLTLGEITAGDELRRCLALGADALYQIAGHANQDPYAKALALAGAAERLGADLVLCGKESLDRQNGQVGAFLAASLGFAFVSAITDLEYRPDEARFLVTRSGGKGIRQKIACRAPAVFSVGLEMAGQRLPSHAGRQRAAAARMRVLPGPDAPTQPRTSVLSTNAPRPRTLPEAAPDNALPAFKRVQELLSGSKAEKKGEILKGETEILVRGIIEFLRDKGFTGP